MRIICLLTDLIAYDGQKGISQLLDDRLKILFNLVVPKFQSDEIHFLYRPIADLSQITQFKTEKDKFYCNFDFIELIKTDDFTCDTVLIPIAFIYVLRFFYREGKFADLAAEKEPKNYEIVGKFAVNRRDFIAINDCSCLFLYKSSEDEFDMIEFGGPDDFCFFG